MTKRFTIKQTVFQAITDFARKTDHKAKTETIEFRVISRIVDACGDKQMTFTDRGRDSIFGKKHKFSVDNTVFATSGEAFAFLENQKAKYESTTNSYKITVVIYPNVVGDNTWVDATI